MEKVLTSGNIAEILSGNKMVLVDFWAPWCGPCRMLGPTIEEIAQEYEGRVCVCKCCVDDERELSERFGIMNIPTLLFFKGGALVDSSVGLVGKEKIEEKLNKLI